MARDWRREPAAQAVSASLPAHEACPAPSSALNTSLPTAPGVTRRRSAWQVQRAVLFAMVLREMQQRVGGQWVGAVWTLLEPLAHTLLILSVLGFLHGALTPSIEYPVYLVTGLIPYFFFQNLTLRLMAGIEANRGVYAYRQVKPMDALLSRAAVEAIMNLVVYLLTLGILAWLGYHILPSFPLEAIGVNFVIGFLGVSMGIFLAVVAYESPRLQSFVRMAFMPLYFATGVIFPVNILPKDVFEWLLWNPMLHLVELSRSSFIPQYRPDDGVNLLYPTIFALTVCALGMALYRVRRLRLSVSS